MAFVRALAKKGVPGAVEKQADKEKLGVFAMWLDIG